MTNLKSLQLASLQNKHLEASSTFAPTTGNFYLLSLFHPASLYERIENKHIQACNVHPVDQMCLFWRKIIQIYNFPKSRIATTTLRMYKETNKIKEQGRNLHNWGMLSLLWMNLLKIWGFRCCCCWDWDWAGISALGGGNISNKRRRIWLTARECCQ